MIFLANHIFHVTGYCLHRVVSEVVGQVSEHPAARQSLGCSDLSDSWSETTGGLDHFEAQNPTKIEENDVKTQGESNGIKL